jgi:hypothetical protein
MTNLDRGRYAAIWAMTPADHLDTAIRLSATELEFGGHEYQLAKVQVQLLFALVKKTLGEPRFENEGAGS